MRRLHIENHIPMLVGAEMEEEFNEFGSYSIEYHDYQITFENVFAETVYLRAKLFAEAVAHGLGNLDGDPLDLDFGGEGDNGEVLIAALQQLYLKNVK